MDDVSQHDRFAVRHHENLRYSLEFFPLSKNAPPADFREDFRPTGEVRRAWSLRFFPCRADAGPSSEGNAALHPAGGSKRSMLFHEGEVWEVRGKQADSSGCADQGRSIDSLDFPDHGVDIRRSQNPFSRGARKSSYCRRGQMHGQHRVVNRD